MRVCSVLVLTATAFRTTMKAPAPRGGRRDARAEVPAGELSYGRKRALEIATTLALDPDSEVAMFTGEGAELVQINWMHDASEEALRDCAGCTATLRF